MAVGERIREEREKRGWTQGDLSKHSGTNRDTISGVESGRHRPRPSTLRKLAGAFGLEVRDLFEEATPSPKAEPLSLEWALDPRVSDEEYKAAMAQASVEDYTRLRRQLRQQGQWVEVEPARIGDAPQRIKSLPRLASDRLRATPPITLFRMVESDEGNRCYWYIPRSEWEEHRETVDVWFRDKPYEDVDARGMAQAGPQGEPQVHKEAAVYAA